jgi:hypothetical protein
MVKVESNPTVGNVPHQWAFVHSKAQSRSYREPKRWFTLECLGLGPQFLLKSLVGPKFEVNLKQMTLNEKTCWNPTQIVVDNFA